MNLVSFPHYTCGGLLCDMLNDTFSKVGNNGGIASIEHSIGKIGDASDVFANFNVDEFFLTLEKLDTQRWIGTHCWLGDIDLGRVNRVINVTTETYRSRLYRWIRAYHHYYLASEPWQGLDGISKIDKQRETAKNYVKPFQHIRHPRVINIEFSDVVESKVALLRLVDIDISKHMNRWRDLNSFLYDQNLWSSQAAMRFHEAEYELNLQQRYVYE